MAGILCARELQSRGIECLLVEGNTIGSGITSGTTAVLSTLHDPLYQDLSARFGQEPARLYFLANWEALEKYRTLAQRYPCDFQERPHYRYAMTQAQAERLKTEAELLQRLGFSAEYRKETPLPFPVAGAVYLPGMAQFHPLRFLYGLASNLKIRENTPVLGISNGVAFTEQGKILARKIIVATHFPLGRFRGLYFMKLYQRRSYVVALGAARMWREPMPGWVQTASLCATWRQFVPQRRQAPYTVERAVGRQCETLQNATFRGCRSGMPGPTRIA
ncbi:MAG: NAD(P)/FAD-dependent oxidoreductase [Oscillospiraceae bacterium]